jgi:Cu/Ag efflux pump CusA
MSRHSLGTSVIGGMLAATFIATFFVPLFFRWIAGFRRKSEQPGSEVSQVNA